MDGNMECIASWKDGDTRKFEVVGRSAEEGLTEWI